MYIKTFVRFCFNDIQNTGNQGLGNGCQPKPLANSDFLDITQTLFSNKLFKIKIIALIQYFY